MWLGNDKLKATDWGWEVRNNYLQPVCTTDPPMPRQLLQQISCSCKGNCSTMSCGCKKHGLRCSDLCVNCQQAENDILECCENYEDKAPEIDDEEEEEERITDIADSVFGNFPNFEIDQQVHSSHNDSDNEDD